MKLSTLREKLRQEITQEDAEKWVKANVTPVPGGVICPSAGAGTGIRVDIEDWRPFPAPGKLLIAVQFPSSPEFKVELPGHVIVPEDTEWADARGFHFAVPEERLPGKQIERFMVDQTIMGDKSRSAVIWVDDPTVPTTDQLEAAAKTWFETGINIPVVATPPELVDAFKQGKS